MHTIISLNGTWKCTGTTPGGERIQVAAEVPGSVHTALEEAGLIQDLFVGDNASRYQWVEHVVWTFERAFVLETVQEDMWICFEGLDVYCDILINGQVLAATDNMFLEHRFHVGGLLREGENVIRVVCRPPEEEVAEKPVRSAAFGNWSRLYTRRIQCTYGWDWVERFVTCGIVRDVYLYCDDLTELEDAYIYTEDIDAYSAQLKMEFRFRAVGHGTWLHMEILDPDGARVYDGRKRIVEKRMYQSVDVPRPRLWYPNGYGEQDLYRIRLEIRKEDGDCPSGGESMKMLSARELAFGIRTIKVLQLQDMPGSAFYEKCLALQEAVSFSQEIMDYEKNTEFFGFVVLVNQVPILCKGANWVPCEPFRFQGNAGKIKHILSLAQKAGLNMLRIWGGGVFEEEILYEECDRLGILVTQDFLMACGSYPCEEAWFREQLEREALFAVKKLRNHACLAWWSGDNENAAGGSDNLEDYEGRRGVRGSILPVVKEYDHKREIFPSSPYGGERYASLTSGTTHNTQFMVPKFVDVRTKDMEDYEAYFDRYLSRFDNEEPAMGAPCLESLRRFMTQEEIFGPDTTMWQYHTKNNPAGEFLQYSIFQYHEIFAQKLLGHFRNPQDRLMKMQYIQYELVRKSMELYRREKWFSAGIVYWMLNDEWPASGWAMIDYYGVPKAGYYAFAQTAQPVVASVARKEGRYCVYICNDGVKEDEGTLTVRAENFAGKSHVWTCEFVSEANVSRVVMEIPEEEMALYTDKTSVLLCDTVSRSGRHHTRYYCSKPANVAWPPACVSVLRQEEGQITLVSDAYVPAVRLEGAVFEDNYFALQKGVPKAVGYRRLKGQEEGQVQIEIWKGADC